MNPFVWASWITVLTVFLCRNVQSRSPVKREIPDTGLDPTKIEVDIPVEDRGKRAYDHHHDFQVPEVDYKAQGVEHKYHLKNALLGFVFHKINSFIDQKTEWIDHLDKANIPKNKAAGIEPPKDEKATLAGAISGIIGSKLEAAGPERKSSSWQASTTPRGPTTTEDIVIFEKGQPVSLEVPDRLFGSSVSLAINLSSTVGDYIMNSSMRLANGLHAIQPFLKKIGKGDDLVIEATVNGSSIFGDNRLRK